MHGLLLAVLAQAAAPPVPERFSILVPIADQPCARAGEDDAIVVCGDPLPAQSLPYPDEVVPNRPVPSNPQLTGTGALNAEGTPCAAMQRGCQVGIGPPIMPLVAGAARLIGDAFRAKPDKRGRISIPLDDPAPPGN